ncbi:hypothetical protein B4064_1868 [Caldibacillus thermoamylovorans]|nr:hypothetical protein B4064_1868 [Caldibacillus thermoamylovorans]
MVANRPWNGSFYQPFGWFFRFSVWFFLSTFNIIVPVFISVHGKGAA